MQIIADLQLHSKYSRAVSPQMNIPGLAMWAKRKGIGLIATGDWTHPLWFREIETNLEEVGNGLLRLKSSEVNIGVALEGSSFAVHPSNPGKVSPSNTLKKDMTVLEKTRLPAPQISFVQDPLFLLATEVSCIYSQGGKGRRVHTLIWVPSLDSARKINKEMAKRGCNLMSDGRPIIGLTSIDVAELVLTIEPKALIIPAHAWTPWFAVFGKMSGFNSLEEAFGPYAKYIYAVETGLSSNPSMNWRIKELDTRAIVSFSDAHSGPKLGREATVFEIPDGNLSYDAIYEAIAGSRAEVARSPRSKIAYTIEFYPEEGKYHYTGHRACNIRQTPLETKARGIGCPVCGKPLTQGVMERVEELAGRSEADLQLSMVNHQLSPGVSVQMTTSRAFPNRPGFVMLVPLQEIISECIGSPVASPKVQGPYEKLINTFGGEFSVLLSTPIDEIAKVAGERVAQGVEKVRSGDLIIDPGYDGVFGVVKLWKDDEEKPLVDASKEQLSLL